MTTHQSAQDDTHLGVRFYCGLCVADRIAEEAEFRRQIDTYRCLPKKQLTG